MFRSIALSQNLYKLLCMVMSFWCFEAAVKIKSAILTTIMSRLL